MHWLYCVFCHTSSEPGHRLFVRPFTGQRPADLGLRLGEGSGAALAFPLVKAAARFINSMASFESAGVSRAILSPNCFHEKFIIF